MSTVVLKLDPSSRPSYTERPFKLTIGTATKRLTESEVESLSQDCLVALREIDRLRSVGTPVALGVDILIEAQESLGEVD